MSSFYIETLFCRDVKKVWWTGLMREGKRERPGRNNVYRGKIGVHGDIQKCIDLQMSRYHLIYVTLCFVYPFMCYGT